MPVSDDILGSWNTSSLDAGLWTIRLSAEDLTGNTSLRMVTVDLSLRKELITAFDAAPALFSPNNDGLLENTLINYEVTNACDVSIEMHNESGIIVDSYTTSTLSGGTYSYTWDGSEIIDGKYTLNLTAVLTSNSAVTQTETKTVNIDTTPPVIDIVKPEADSYIQTNVTVQGSIIDENIVEYEVSYAGESGTEVINSANQSRQDYTFGILNDMAEGMYSLNVTAKDLGENTTQSNIAFTIDRTPPEVTMDTPKTGEYYGTDKDTVNVSGSIDEKNLDSYSVRYRAGTAPTQWTDLLTGDTLPSGAELFVWNVGVNDGVPDGLYTLSLYAKDKAGFEKEVRAEITVDNTVPEALLSLPAEGSYVKEATSIEGTALDENLDNYTVEFSEGSCTDAYKWAAIISNTDAVQNGILSSWQVLPTDGNYCMRLTVVDKSRNKSEAKTGFQIDTHPPEAVVLSGTIEDGTGVSLNWTTSTEPDFAGYNIYRDGRKLNTDLLTGNNRLDLDLGEGDYVYTVRVVDFAGWESEPSSEIKLTVDQTGPSARISSPKDGSAVSGIVDIKGAAYSDNDFKEYRVYTAEGADPAVWDLIRTSPLSVSYGVLAQWDTVGLGDGIYSVKLETEDIYGNVNTYQIIVTIDNDPPATPVLISVIAAGPDVDVQWQANTETDLAGYLLYRNDRLVNVSGLVVGDLKPYLIIATSYLNEGLPDGQFRYYLAAMDEAGNVSGQSDAIEVDIDTHDPQADIVDPLDGSGFEKTMLVLAETPDLDIDSVQFQYKAVQDSLWTDLGSAVSSQPYANYLDPETIGLSYGDYDLRAIATDNGGRTDQTPPSITVTYADLTVPEIPLDLSLLTDGSDAGLSWEANTDEDLEGYNLYRTGNSGEGTAREKINTIVITGTTYQDDGLLDGSYTYEVTAVDTFGNESGPSGSAHRADHKRKRI